MAMPLENPLTTIPLTAELLALIVKPFAPDVRLPLSTISGPFALVLPVNAVWVTPSIVAGLVIDGSEEAGLIVNTPPTKPGSEAGTLKLIVLASAFAFAAPIASRRLQSSEVQKPSLVSAVFVTINVTGIESSFVIVPVPWLSAMTALVALVSITKNVSFGSNAVSPVTWTVSPAEVALAGIVTEPPTIAV